MVAATLCAFIAQAQHPSIDNHLRRAYGLYELGDYSQARKELTKARSMAGNLYTHQSTVLSRVALLDALCQAHLADGTEPLKAWVEDNGSSPHLNEALYALAGEYFEQQCWQQALEYYNRVDVTRITDYQAERLCFEGGYAAYRHGDRATAEELLGRVEKSSGYFAHAKYTLGYMAYEVDDLAVAKREFGAIAKDEHYAPIVDYYLLNIAHRQGDYAYVVSASPRVLDGLAGARRQEVMRLAAESAFALERWAEAEGYVAMIVEEYGEAARSEHYIAGYSLYRLGNHSVAVESLRLVCGPDDDMTQNAAYHLADCYLHTGDKKSAMHSFSMAYSSGDDEQVAEDALYNYCKLQVEQGGGNFDEEIRILGEYLSLYPSSPHRTEIERYLVTVCYDAKDLKMAYHALAEHASSGAGFVREAMQKVAYYYAAECYSLGRLSEAEEYLNLSLDLRDYSELLEARALFLLGEVDYATGHYKLAASMFDQYIDLGYTREPDYPFAYYNAGYARFNSSHYEASYDDFADFVELYDGAEEGFVADAYNRLGDVECAAKSYKAAAEMYRKAAATSSEPERYYGAYRAAMMEGLAGNTDARILSLEKIVAEGSGPYVVRSHFELGHTLISSGSYERGAAVLEQFTKRYSVRTSSDYAAALADLGLAYRNMQQDDKALATYKRVVEVAKGSVAAYNAMGEIRNICVEQNRVGDYFDYAARMGMASDNEALQRDSLDFVAAQRLYIAGYKEMASSAFDNYITSHPEGAYSAAAYYYSADCHIEGGNSERAFELLERLTSMYYNPYTQRGYERLAQLQLSSNNLAGAAESYKSLSEVATTPVARRQALEGYLSAVVASADNGAIIEAADWVLAAADAGEPLVRRAKLYKAKALEAEGKRNPAVALYSGLSESVADEVGAEAAYKIIQTAFQYGSFEKAEALVYEFADKNTPHTYWLAKSFLLLGDVYVSRGDLFQARATYQSIVDGYSAPVVEGQEDILSLAKERIAELN